MAQHQQQLPERYTEGVWYDAQAGDFCQIREWEDTVGLFTPDVQNFEEHGPYFTFDEIGYEFEDAVSELGADFTRVSDEVVENPARFLEDTVSDVMHGERIGAEFQTSINIQYALRQVWISNQSETEILSEYYEEVRESARVAMLAEGVDEGTAARVLAVMDDNV